MRWRVGNFAWTWFDGLLAVSVLALVLSSCVPVEDFAADRLNAVAGDGAALYLVTDADAAAGACEGLAESSGFCVDPADAPMLGVLLSVQGDDLAVAAACDVTSLGLICDLGAVEVIHFISADGVRVSATMTYRREGGNRVYQEIAQRID